MKSLAELEAIRIKNHDDVAFRTNTGATKILVGMGTCGIASGARIVMAKILEELSKRNISNVTVAPKACKGACDKEPFVEVVKPGEDKVTYVNMTPEKVVRIIEEHIENGKAVAEYTD